MQKDPVYPMIGSHESIGKMTTLDRIKTTRESRGLNVVQFFNGNKFSEYRRTLSKEDTSEILDYTNSSMVKAFAHSPYCINLARDPKDETKHLNTLYGDIKAMGPAGISSVCHIGNHMNKFSIESVCRTLSVFDFWGPDDTYPLLLENSAGDGTGLGVTWEEWKFLAQNTDPHVGFCIDTQHAFAASVNEIDFRTVDGVNEFFKKLDRTVGLNRVKLFHLNDSKYDPTTPGGKKDSHANISRGYIWGNDKNELKGLRQLLLRGGELGIPFITETPSVEVPVKNKDGSDGVVKKSLDPEIVYDFLARGE